MTRTNTVFSSSLHLELAFLIFLFFILFLARAHAAQVTLSWTANREIDLAGYKVYSGTTSHTYNQPVVLASAGQTSISLSMPEDGRTYFFAVTAYDAVNQESPLSAEVSWKSPLANRPPVANASSLVATEDVVANGTLSASDPDGNRLSYAIVSNGGKGTVTLTNAATGAYSYKPNANANGTDSFTFKANDGKLDSKVATVSVTITAVNDAPVANNGSLTLLEDTPATGTLGASDVDGNSLSYAIVSNGSKGTVTLTNAVAGAYGYSYKPNANANGTDSFTFKANDGKLDSKVATVSVTITAVNDAPKASNGSLAVPANTPALGKLVASDVDGNSLSYAIVSNGSKGTVTVTNAATGAYTYKPNAIVIGTDSFTFKAKDGKVDSNLATVSISIKAPVSILMGQANNTPQAVDGIRSADKKAKASVIRPEGLGVSSGIPIDDSFYFPADLNDASWKNYRLSVIVSSLDDDVVDIIFRHQDSNNYYGFIWDTLLSLRQLIKCENGEATVLAEDNVPGVFGKAYKLEVVADESILEIRVDDALIFSVMDTSFEQGGVALRSLNHVEKGFFEDIQVEDLATGQILFERD